ncbi:hypothetical protein QJS04_geneDACA022321 [Acorus gramineus]|uniref:Uncharacterized protein n=1 Tax=Acorus gramineus TaxID=55184 RepID=A0AAV9AJQ8_ACOGR|nr:hypothetical protein QJS04_geneDACA022321 [Acorus gramineus]
MKTLQLDPNNTSVRENIQVAAQKLHEAHQRTTQEANAGSTSSQTSNSQSTGQRNQSCPFPSFSFGGPAVPDLSNIFMNMASSVHQGQQPHDMPPNGNASAPVEPETRMDGNINLNFGDITQDISGALRSVMGRMFSPPNDPRDDAPRDSGSG